jgi:hypothetical protein
MDPDFRPHGLIIAPIMKVQYLSAKKSVDEHGNLLVDPKEYKAVKLFYFLLNKVLFPGFNYAVSPGQPPGLQSLNKCDIIVEPLTQHKALQVLCFAEANGANKQSISLVEAVEEQAFGYSKEFVAANDNVDIVFACTIIGASIRCWTYFEGNEKLCGFWDGDQSHSYACYLDIGEDANRARIENAFEMMKDGKSFNDIGAQGLSHFRDHF